MKVKYGVTGKKRKELVMAIAEITGSDAVYKGVPTCSYEVDYFTIDRNGTLSFDDRADSEEIETLLEQLAEKGFIAEEPAVKESDEKEEYLSEESEKSEQWEGVGLTVELPADMVSIDKLNALISAKGCLIKKALGIETLPIEITEENVSFPWFSKAFDTETTKAYTHFISSLCEMSIKQKRINAAEMNIENEKYTFRCFLLRLGFIGSEYKAERKILLKNLSGSSAFKNKEKKENIDEISK